MSRNVDPEHESGVDIAASRKQLTVPGPSGIEPPVCTSSRSRSASSSASPGWAGPPDRESRSVHLHQHVRSHAPARANPALYVSPSPRLRSCRMTSTPPISSATFSARSAVPSGLPSSTTRTPASGSARRVLRRPPRWSRLRRRWEGPREHACSREHANGRGRRGPVRVDDAPVDRNEDRVRGPPTTNPTWPGGSASRNPSDTESEHHHRHLDDRRASSIGAPRIRLPDRTSRTTDDQAPQVGTPVDRRVGKL